MDYPEQQRLNEESRFPSSSGVMRYPNPPMELSDEDQEGSCSLIPAVCQEGPSLALPVEMMWESWVLHHQGTENN